MAYFETAQTISTVSTMVLGHVVTQCADGASVYVEGRNFVANIPDTLPEYLALPERDDMACAACGRQQVTVYRDVVTCACGERWRWHSMVGGD